MALSRQESPCAYSVLSKHGAGRSSLLLNRNAMWIGAAWLWAVALVAERGASWLVRR